MGRRHLFLAMSRAAYGEATLALRLAWQLHARGDEVVVLAPSELGLLFSGTPFRFGAIDAVWRAVDDALPAVIARQRCDDVLLVDLTATIVACRLFGLDPSFVHRLAVPVAALDCWNLPETNRRWDLGADGLDVSGLDVAVRLVPVPFARPSAPGAYCALPDGPDAPPARRNGDAAPRVLLTTAAWQAQPARGGAQPGLLHQVPELLVAELAQLPAAAEILHVGPAPLAGSAALGARYRWQARVPPAELRAQLAGSDLLVTLNLASTTIGSALGLAVPAVVAVHTAAADPAAYRFRVWPLGLHDFLTPVLDGNPYTGVVRTAEIFAPGALAAACRTLLDDGDARADFAERCAAYVAAVRALPSGAEVLSSLA